MLSEATLNQLRETANGLRASIAALTKQGEKDGVDRSVTIAMERGLLESLEKQFRPASAEATPEAPAQEPPKKLKPKPATP